MANVPPSTHCRSTAVRLLASEECMELGDRVVDGERRRLLAGRELLVRLEELCGDGATEARQVVVVEEPVPAGVRRGVGPFEGVGPEVEDLRQAQRGERFGPDPQGAAL